jgi:hypothetical protein
MERTRRFELLRFGLDEFAGVRTGDDLLLPRLDFTLLCRRHGREDGRSKGLELFNRSGREQSVLLHRRNGEKGETETHLLVSFANYDVLSRRTVVALVHSHLRQEVVLFLLSRFFPNRQFFDGRFARVLIVEQRLYFVNTVVTSASNGRERAQRTRLFLFISA